MQRSGTSPVLELRRNLFAGCESQDLDLLGGAVELVLAEVRRQVDESPGGSREGQAVENGGIEGVGSMDAQARPVAWVTTADGEVNVAGVRPDPPERSGCVMAEHGAPPGCEDGGHFTAPSGRDWTDLVDAVEHWYQPPTLDAVCDRASTEPGGEELRSRHDAVLPSG